MKRIIVLSVLFLVLIAVSVCVISSRCEASDKPPEERGLEIAEEVDRRDNGFENQTGDMVMIIKNRHGDESLRNLRVRVLEVEGDGDKNLSIFDDPRDVKGTAFLVFSHKFGSDDQWLYLPALKRVKRISSSNKSGSFMGSEFAYEDISSQEVEKYTYKWIRNEQCPTEEYKDFKCFAIERYPVDAHSGYTRQVVWIDQGEYRIIKIDFYDRKNAELKTLTHKGYKQYLGKFWRSHEMYMENYQTGKTTRLLWDNYKFRTGLKESDFNRNALKRAR
ncbi:Outer membrane lipoprotein-sorting protein [hydrothermal vent metagenome]|uniref:Outer membrane lipoprotein-sorting protein n=1 Tax=hydrothermal vent metagenome TaxID=652676 RepID=A0A3B0QS98_9ZZZZ